jgi:hypothetical protein
MTISTSALRCPRMHLLSISVDYRTRHAAPVVSFVLLEARRHRMAATTHERAENASDRKADADESHPDPPFL